jgi:dienelactone hydrolase
MRFPKTLFLLLLMPLLSPDLRAVPADGTDIEYKDGETVLEGYVARPMTRDLIKRPAVLIVHNWLGLKEYEKERAKMNAELGYVAFAVDIYGKGVRPKDQKEAGALAGKYKGDIPLFRQRLKAAYDELLKRPDVDPKRIAISGYCFGGTGALELARSGADLVGAASFHGSVGSKTPEDAKNIKGSVLVMHGAVDPYVPAEEVAAFKKEMDEAKVDYQFVAYSGAVHSFTEKEAGTDPSKGAAYDAKADERSWKLYVSFLEEIFAEK